MSPTNLGACDESIRSGLLPIFAAACAITLFLVYRLLRPGRSRMYLRPSLQLSYLAYFWIYHWIAVPVYLMPWYCNEHASYTLLGARESLYGLLGFGLGAVLVPYVVKARPVLLAHPPEIPAATRHSLLTLGIAFTILGTWSAGAPGLQALLGGVKSTTIVAVMLSIWAAASKRDYRTMLKWLGLSVVFPFFTIVSSGFLGFGIQSLAPIAIFTITCIPPKNFKRFIVPAILAGYLGLSLYVTYMRDRFEIRRTVWGNEAYSSRLGQLGKTISEFDWFSMYNPRHLDLIEARLNQNFLVGASVVYIENTKVWAAGKTLWNAALAFIPRVLWPDKPSNSGGDLVSQYTGIQFAYGTAVGIGQVMEFYVNFGSGMVFLGFLIFGGVLSWLDSAASIALANGEFHRFVVVYLVGLSMQQLGGSLMEVIGSIAGSLVLSFILRTIIAEPGRPRRRPQKQPARLVTVER